jgi:class 3 adenylate cyclase/pimeloyl-ACP methyl ester carboxylesterase
MAEETIQRRLAAILAADVVGYSKLMGEDEAGTLKRLKQIRRDIFNPGVKRLGGRIFKTTGDGALVEFHSAAAAVRCAVEIQKELAGTTSTEFEHEPITLRIGISLGDVIVEGGDLYGNGVNVAARMEALAIPGGICISANIQEHIKQDDEFFLEDFGAHDVKNIAEPVRTFRVLLESRNVEPPAQISSSDQTIQFMTTDDGVRIAYAVLGEGPPVVFVSNWVTHLELDWQIASRGMLFDKIIRDHMLVRYDARGNGLSDLDVDEISVEASVHDLAKLIETLKLDRVALVGASQGAAVAAAYAARNPDKVSRLILYGGYARGRRKRGSEGQIAESDAFITMIREGWGKQLDAYVRMFGTFFMPDADAEQLARFTEFQRRATPPENAARIQLSIDNVNIADELPNITAPTLVLHVREDARAPFEEGRLMAAAIPGARFVPLEGRNHSMLADEPAMERFLTEVGEFLRQ